MAKRILPIFQLRTSCFRNVLDAVQSRLPELNFITIHYSYFIFTSLFSGLIFWGSATPFGSVSFVDSLFLTTSAMTEAGLNTVNISELNTWQQVILFLLIIVGSAIFVSTFVLLVRLKTFEAAFTRFNQDRINRRLKGRETGFRRIKAFFTRTHPRSISTSAPHPDGESVMRLEKQRSVMDRKAMQRHHNFARNPSSNEANASILPSNTITNGSFGERHCRSSRSEDRENALQNQLGYDEHHNHWRHEESLHQSTRTEGHVDFRKDTQFHRHTDEAYRRIHNPFFSFNGVGANAGRGLRPRSRSSSNLARPSIASAAALQGLNSSSTNAYFTSGWISRNSQFHGLTTEERLALGGYEYRAVVFLSFLVPFYLVIWQLLGALAIGAYVHNNRASTTLANGLKPFWVGAFNAISAFKNSGMSPLDANMIAFQNSVFMLLSMGLLILAGNTAYPIFLRAAVWTIWKLIPSEDPNWDEEKKTLRFLLDHPRRVYTNLFPSRHTWWLAGAVTALNLIDWAFFPILNIGNRNITDQLSPGFQVLDGLFQALAVRSGGFYVVPIPDLRISLQFLYVIMMYISAYPIVISMRNSNVYEEQSLGVFIEDMQGPELDENVERGIPMGATSARLRSHSQLREGLRRRITNISEKAAPAPKRDTMSYFVRYQLRAQLAHDAWFLAFAIFLILVIEASQFEAHPGWFSVFNIIFEVVSGYGTVGISVGVPYNSFSFCGSWHTLSKLVLIAVMIRGRHRGLPVANDHAVQLPKARLYGAEIEDSERRLDRIERSDTSRSHNDSLSPALGSKTTPTSELQRAMDASREGWTTAREVEDAQRQKP